MSLESEQITPNRFLPSSAERIYFYLVLGLASIIFLLSIIVFPEFYLIYWWDFILFAVLAILAEQTHIILPRGAKISASFSVMLASIILFNPPIVAIIAAIVSIFTNLVMQRREVSIVLFNVAQYTISYTVAALTMRGVIEASSTTLADYHIMQLLLAAGAATLVYLLINIPIVNGYVSLRENPNLSLTKIRSHFFFPQDDLTEITQTIFFYPIAVMVAEFYAREHNLIILAVLMALILGGLKFIEQRQKIEHQNEKMAVLYELTKDCGELILREADVEVTDNDLFKALLKTANHLQINKILPNHRLSVYRVEFLDAEDEVGRLVHQESNQVLEPEKVYHLDEEGFLQDIVFERKGRIKNDLGDLNKAYIAWRIIYQSLLAQPIMLDEEVAYVLVLFREQGEQFNKKDEQMLKLLVKPLEITLKNIQLRKKIQEQAIKDGLMGIFNHRYLKNKMDEELSRAKRYKKPLALIIADVDYFKKFNDTHGHLLGDRVLKEIAQILQDSVRETDILARYGGEELAVLLPETSLEAACEVAERIRKNVAKHEFVGKDNAKVLLSMSMGVTCTDEDPELQVSEMIVRADTALYKAKNQGRNQICRAVVEQGKLIIATYSRGEMPKIEDKSLVAGALKPELQQAWLENLNKNQSQLIERFEAAIQERPELKTIYKNYFKRKIIPEIPLLFTSFLQTMPTDMMRRMIWRQEFSEQLSGFRERLQSKFNDRENVLALQELILIAYQFILQQALQVNASEADRKELFDIGYYFLKSLTQAFMGTLWDEFEYLLSGTQQLYQTSHILHQFKTGLKELDTVLQKALEIACQHLQPPGYTLIALPDRYHQFYRIQATWGMDAETDAYLMHNQVLNIPEFLKQSSSNRLQTIETEDLSQYLNPELLNTYLPEIQALIFIPIVYQHQIYGVLGFFLTQKSQFEAKDLRWLEKFCREMAMGLHLNQRLNQSQQQIIHVLKSLIDISEASFSLSRFQAERVSQMAGRLAQKLGLHPHEQVEIKNMAYLHNLGRLLLPTAGGEHGKDWSLQQAVMLGSRFLESIPALHNYVPALRHFQERWDGSGIPEGLAGQQIPRNARIIGLAYAYESRLETLGSPTQVVEELTKTGYYDPSLCSILMKLVEFDEAKV